MRQNRLQFVLKMPETSYAFSRRSFLGSRNFSFLLDDMKTPFFLHQTESFGQKMLWSVTAGLKVETVLAS